MTFILPPGRPAVPTSSTNETIHRRLIAEGVNRANQGHVNATIFVTLDPGLTETMVTDSRISIQTSALLQPTTANAAAALATTWIVCTNGSLTISHVNNTQTDRSYNLGIVG